MKLALRKENVDWLKIINMMFKKEDWGKRYTLYTSGDATVTATMRSFDFELNEAVFDLRLSFSVNDEIHTGWASIHYRLKNFSIEDFEMHLKKKLVSLITDTEKKINITLAKRKVKAKEYFYWNMTEKHYKEAGYSDAFDKIKELPEELQDSIIESLNDKTADKLNELFLKELNEIMKEPMFIHEGLSSIYMEVKQNEKSI